MALTPEAKVKKKIVEQLKALKAYYFFPATGIECKAGKNTPTALQEMNLKQIAEAHGLAYVVNEENMHDIKQLLEE